MTVFDFVCLVSFNLMIIYCLIIILAINYGQKGRTHPHLLFWEAYLFSKFEELTGSK